MDTQFLGTDKWYRALTFIGAAGIAGAVAIPHDPALQKALLWLSLGGCLLGLGEWINHPYQAAIHSSGAFKIHGYARKPGVGGTVFAIAGLVAAGRGLWLLW